MFHLSHRASLSLFEHTRSVFTVRKSIAVEPMPGHVIYAYNKGQRCLSLLHDQKFKTVPNLLPRLLSNTKKVGKNIRFRSGGVISDSYLYCHDNAKLVTA